MKKVFDAANSVEAYLVVNMLEQYEIDAQVDGEYLQGGMGELPVSGLVRVVVADVDYNQARSVIKKWDAQQSSPANENYAESMHENYNLAKAVMSFIAGLLIGGILGFWVLSSPVT